MINIQIGDEFLESEVKEINITFTSPLFTNKEIVGDWSIPFTVPTTPKNKRILKQAHRLDTVYNSEELETVIYHNNIKLHTGYIYISKASEQKYELMFVCNNSRIISKITDKKLSDITWDNFTFNHEKTIYRYPADKIAFLPIRNDLFWKDTEYYVENNQVKQNQYYFFGSIPYLQSVNQVPFDTTPNTPFPFLCYIIDKIADFTGLKIAQNDIATDPDLCRLILYSNFDITTTTISVTGNTRRYYDSGGAYQGDDVTISHIRSMPANFNIKKSIPDITISEFIFNIENLLNVKFCCIKNSLYIVKRDVILNQFESQDISNHVVFLQQKPNTEIQYEQKAKTNLTIKWDKTSCDYIKEFVIDIEKESYTTVQNISNLPTQTGKIGDIVFVTDTNTYYRLDGLAKSSRRSGIGANQWNIYSLKIDNYYENKDIDEDKQEVFETSCTTLLPQCKIKGNAGYFDEGNRVDAIVLLFAEVKKNTTYGVEQVEGKDVCTMDYTGAYQSYDSDIKGNIICQTDSTNGFLRYWTTYRKWIKNRKRGILEMIVPVSFMQNFSFLNKYTVNGISFFIKQMEVVYYENYVHLKDVEIYTTHSAVIPKTDSVSKIEPQGVGYDIIGSTLIVY